MGPQAHSREVQPLWSEITTAGGRLFGMQSGQEHWHGSKARVILTGAAPHPRPLCGCSQGFMRTWAAGLGGDSYKSPGLCLGLLASVCIRLLVFSFLR